MGQLSSSTKKSLTAKDRRELECILGACHHSIASKSCLYWAKVVDADDPAREQMKLIEKLIKKIK